MSHQGVSNKACSLRKQAINSKTCLRRVYFRGPLIYTPPLNLNQSQQSKVSNVCKLTCRIFTPVPAIQTICHQTLIYIIYKSLDPA